MPDPPEPAVGDSGDGPAPGAAPVDGPSLDALRRTITEQTPLLTGPPLHESVTVRVRRVLTGADELLTLLAGDEAPADEDTHRLVRDTVARAVAWVVESVGAYQRLPAGFASGHVVAGGHAPMLVLVDDLDLLGLTVDHAYDAAHRGDRDHASRQHDVLLERFRTSARPEAVVDESGIRAEDLDEQVVGDQGLEVGGDGIPRLPVPEQPDPHPAPAAAGAGRGDQPQEDQ